MASKEAAQITKFEIHSNEGKTISLLGKGALPLVEYRECIVDHTVRIRALYLDTGQAGGDVGSVETLKLQGAEKVSFSVTHDGKTISFDKNLIIIGWSSYEDTLKVGVELNIASQDFLDVTLNKKTADLFYSGKIS